MYFILPRIKRNGILNSVIKIIYRFSFYMSGPTMSGGASSITIGLESRQFPVWVVFLTVI